VFMILEKCVTSCGWIRNRSFFLSTSALPLFFLYEVVKVPQRALAEIHKIKTSPVDLEYTTYMHGVDVVDQL